jgi:GT2 family glycosyltransferase
VVTLPTVSVLIPQLGRAELTRRAITMVRRSRYRGELEVLVWANGEAGAAPQVGADRTLTSAENLGFGAAMNGLAAAATGELLLLLNNDAVVAPSCLPLLVERLRQPDRPAAVVPQLRSFTGATLEMGSFVDAGGNGWQLLRGQVIPATLRRTGFACHYASAACFLLERERFRELCGFDAVFGLAYYEDTDFCLRLAETAGPVVVEPRAVAFHFEGGTAGEDRPRHMLRNRAVFAARWHSRLAEGPPVSASNALAAALGLTTPGTRILWLLPEPLLPDRSGGQARIAREMSVLQTAGCVQVVWTENGGDGDRSGPLLDEVGIRSFSYGAPERWPLDRPPESPLDSVQGLLTALPFDMVVIWSASLAARLAPHVRTLAPQAKLVIDNGVLAFLQYERACALGEVVADLEAHRTSELEVYRAADAVIASSALEADLLTRELPDLEVFPYDVGAYSPCAANGQRAGGPLFLGNFHHPPNLDAVSWWLDAIAPELEAATGRPVPLRIVGSGSEILRDWHAARGRLEPVGWVEELADELGHARLFVAPLRYGAGTKDKLSMAMRYGLPVVTTSIGAESMPAELARVMIVEDRPDRLAHAVLRLLDDDGAWESAARRTRKAAARAWRRQRGLDSGFASWIGDLLGHRLPVDGPRRSRSRPPARDRTSVGAAVDDERAPAASVPARGLP